MNRFQKFFGQWILALNTFPLTFIILLTITIVGILNIYSGYDADQSLMRILMACLLALPLTVLSPLKTYMAGQTSSTKNTVFSAIAIVIGALFYLRIPVDMDMATNNTILLIVGSIAISRSTIPLMIAFAKKSNEAMTRIWRKELLNAIVIGALAGAVIWGGISACLASLDYLFGVHIYSSAYSYVGVIAMTFITGAITLIHIVNQNTVDRTPNYTRSMRIFGHYIFLPLTIIYACILISYGIKILITGMRPQGRVVYMVIGYVLFGILTWLTTYPSLPDRFISRAHRVLFISFLLVSFLMLRATQMRISQYGITEPRYFVCMIIARIILVSLGSLFFARQRLLIMISVLVGLGVISVYGGKLNAVNTSLSSQKNMLMHVLQSNNISLPLTSGSLANIASGDAGRIYQTIDYMGFNGDEDTLHSLVSADQHHTLDKQGKYMKVDYILNYAGLNYANSDTRYIDDATDEQQYFNWNINSIYEGNGMLGKEISVKGFTYLYMITSNTQGKSGVVSIHHNGKVSTLDLNNYGASLYNTANNPTNKTVPQQEPITLTTDDMTIVLTRVSGYRTNTGSDVKYSIESYDGYALVK